jgi:hypothetical protein
MPLSKWQEPKSWDELFVLIMQMIVEWALLEVVMVAVEVAEVEVLAEVEAVEAVMAVAVEVAAEEAEVEAVEVSALTGPNSRVPLQALLEKRLRLIKDTVTTQ